MLQPKRTKFRKMHKGRNRGLAQGTDVSFGSFGLKAVGRGRLTARQIEAARRAMTRAVKRQGKIWIRVFPDKPITEKPLAVRMGKGKGYVQFGRTLDEFTVDRVFHKTFDSNNNGFLHFVANNATLQSTDFIGHYAPAFSFSKVLTRATSRRTCFNR